MLGMTYQLPEALSGWLGIAFLSVLPFSENRGAILYGVSLGYDPLVVFFFSTVLNILMMIPLLLLLNSLWVRNIIDRILGRWLSRKIEKNKKRLEIYEELALLFFVAVPFLGTGGYTGSLVSAFLKMNVKKSLAVISLGISIAGVITMLAAEGAIAFFDLIG